MQKETRARTALGLRAASGLGVVGLCLSLVLLQPELGHAAGPVLPRAHAVVSESEQAARDALSILDQGGSAADAAVTAALVSGVTAPSSSGIGGGGFVVVWDQKAGRPFVLDFRETAPALHRAEPLERRPLARSEIGHLIGVPGEVRGLYELHRRAGRLPWSVVVGKAAARARTGFPVLPHLARMLGFAQRDMQSEPGFSGLYYPGGKARVEGSRMQNPALAATLERIAHEGPRAFYEGETAADLVATASSVGSALSLADLAGYTVVERAPLELRYAGKKIYTMPPPSAGGLLLAEVLALFGPDELRQLGHGTAAYDHLLAEAMRGAFADRMRFVADPAHHPTSLERLLDPTRLERRKATFGLDRTHALPRFGLEESGTHHLITSDRQGNVVSLTTTVNRLFGAKVMAERSGVVLNDELDDFTAKADVASFGLTESPNRARPGARPVSSMTPTIVVEDGRALLALGGSGGTAIGTNVTQVLLSLLVFGHEPERAVRAPRIYIPFDGRTLLVEKGTPEAHVKDLAWRGELVGEMPFSGTAVQVLSISDGNVVGAADPRKFGGVAKR